MLASQSTTSCKHLACHSAEGTTTHHNLDPCFFLSLIHPRVCLYHVPTYGYQNPLGRPARDGRDPVARGSLQPVARCRNPCHPNLCACLPKIHGRLAWDPVACSRNPCHSGWQHNPFHPSCQHNLYHSHGHRTPCFFYWCLHCHPH